MTTQPTTQSVPALMTGTLVTMLVPQVGRVLALVTAKRSLTSEYVVADHGAAAVYQQLVAADETAGPPPELQIEQVGELAQWLERPEASAAVAAILAATAEWGTEIGPLTFARAVEHMSRVGGDAHAALERAIAIGNACAESHQRTADAVAALVYGQAAGAG